MSSPARKILASQENNVTEFTTSFTKIDRTDEQEVELEVEDLIPPKPPRSAFMCFADAKKKEILVLNNKVQKEEDVLKIVAVAWRNLDESSRAYWDEEARNDKVRFVREKNDYKGPWNLPKRRAKKHPLAPKRPMSAFLKYSQNKRSDVKEQNPDMSNTDVSRLLGEMWRNASEEDRRPYVEDEETERALYKEQIKNWRDDQGKLDAASRTSHHSVRGQQQQNRHPRHNEIDMKGPSEKRSRSSYTDDDYTRSAVNFEMLHIPQDATEYNNTQQPNDRTVFRSYNGPFESFQKKIPPPSMRSSNNNPSQYRPQPVYPHAYMNPPGGNTLSSSSRFPSDHQPDEHHNNPRLSRSQTHSSHERRPLVMTKGTKHEHNSNAQNSNNNNSDRMSHRSPSLPYRSQSSTTDETQQHHHQYRHQHRMMQHFAPPRQSSYTSTTASSKHHEQQSHHPTAPSPPPIPPIPPSSVEKRSVDHTVVPFDPYHTNNMMGHYNENQATAPTSSRPDSHYYHDNYYPYP